VNRLLRALMLLVVLGSLVVAGISYALLAELRRPVDAEAVDPVEFEIASGQTAVEVTQNLKAQDLIRQPLLFQLMLREQDAADNLNAGTYLLSPNMTMGEIIATLGAEQPAFEEKQFTVIEGMRMEEVGQVLVDAGLAPSVEEFVAVAKDAAPFKATHSRLGTIPEGQGLEGYLFPDTYRVRATAAISEVIETMLTDGFDANYETFETTVTIDRPVHEIVTMASIVQREAANNDEMAHLAYIFWNRLKPENLGETGGLIGADPTVQYALGWSEEQQTWWRRNLTVEELAIESEYNTRNRQGLPIGPIANPGLNALKAAARPGGLRPDGSDGQSDLYFVAKCGEDAVHDYATTLDELNRLSAEYSSCNQ
jgi:UPF0755 protein